MENSGYLGSICGIKVIASPLIGDVPVIELNKDLDVSPEFRAKCNQFYLELFGTYKPVYIVGGDYVMHPETIGLINMPGDH